MTLRRYMAYAAGGAARPGEDQPLVLFDGEAFSKAPGLAASWATPRLWAGRDLFAALGPSRPHHAWLIAGPQGSGSLWHVDPNATSAYNALLCGRKRWLLWPPGPPPPGVYAAADGSHTSQPLSIVEWAMDFYAPAARDGRLRAVTLVPGQVMHVPAGWWHAVLNLASEEAPQEGEGAPQQGEGAPQQGEGAGLIIAITENYAPRAAVPAVLRWLEAGGGGVSGVPRERREGLAGEWRAALRAAGAWEEAWGEAAEPEAGGPLVKRRKGAAGEVAEEAQARGWGFGFVVGGEGGGGVREGFATN